MYSFALYCDDEGRTWQRRRSQVISQLERGFGGRERMGEAIARCLKRRNYSLSHAFLAGLPTLETVTTNYDTLFEMASASIDKPVAVLPYEPVRPEERWILKMHGCISHPEDIVLTREDYLRYTERRRALAGIVQALLITKHMMFVGFSLDDDNFHRIADDVRKIVWANERGEPFGTSIVLDSRPFLAQMWDGEIEMVVVDESEQAGVATNTVAIAAYLEGAPSSVRRPSNATSSDTARFVGSA